MFRYGRILVSFGILFLLSPLCACAVEATDDEYSYSYSSISGKCSVYDPYENINRKIFKFNAVLDKIIFKPVAKTYGYFTNDYTKDRVGSFLTNIREPLSTVNYSAQGNSKGALTSLWRFVINSTLGVAGIFDVASKFGLQSTPQTFSNTLAYYGMGEGPYVVLPIFGGYSFRDVGDVLAFDYFLNPLTYVVNDNVKLGESITKAVHYRENVLPFTDYVEKHSVDPYTTVRNAILSQGGGKKHYPEGYVCPHFFDSSIK